jgi:hypothetical protein
MAEKPTTEFGQRKRVAIQTARPVKRSKHVALLLMGTFAIGSGAYALMPSENCEQNRPGMAATPNARHVDHPVEAAAGPAGHRRAAVSSVVIPHQAVPRPALRPIPLQAA